MEDDDEVVLLRDQLGELWRVRDQLAERVHTLEAILMDILGTADAILAERPGPNQAYWALDGMRQIARNCKRVGIERRGAAGR